MVPLTNCTEIWGCAFRNWGLMQGTLKLEAREWDFDWHCWNVAEDPRRAPRLGVRGCGLMADAARGLFKGLPAGKPEPTGALR